MDANNKNKPVFFQAFREKADGSGRQRFPQSDATADQCGQCDLDHPQRHASRHHGDIGHLGVDDPALYPVLRQSRLAPARSADLRRPLLRQHPACAPDRHRGRILRPGRRRGTLPGRRMGNRRRRPALSDPGPGQHLLRDRRDFELRHPFDRDRQSAPRFGARSGRAATLPGRTIHGRTRRRRRLRGARGTGDEPAARAVHLEALAAELLRQVHALRGRRVHADEASAVAAAAAARRGPQRRPEQRSNRPPSRDASLHTRPHRSSAAVAAQRSSHFTDTASTACRTARSCPPS